MPANRANADPASLGCAFAVPWLHVFFFTEEEALEGRRKKRVRRAPTCLVRWLQSWPCFQNTILTCLVVCKALLARFMQARVSQACRKRFSPCFLWSLACTAQELSPDSPQLRSPRRASKTHLRLVATWHTSLPWASSLNVRVRRTPPPVPSQRRQVSRIRSLPPPTA